MCLKHVTERETEGEGEREREREEGGLQGRAEAPVPTVCCSGSCTDSLHSPGRALLRSGTQQRAVGGSSRRGSSAGFGSQRNILTTSSAGPLPCRWMQPVAPAPPDSGEDNCAKASGRALWCHLQPPSLPPTSSAPPLSPFLLDAFML